MIGIDGKEKPIYNEGDEVEFDFDRVVKGKGKIRGRSTDPRAMPIDMWIIEVDESTIDRAFYSYSCIVVPHTLLKPLKR